MDNENFEQLDIEQQIKIFAESPITEKGDLILRSQEPDKLTRSLASEELYLILKEMDTEERAELVKYANLDQLFFISDIDCWNKDRMNPAAFVQWLEVLRQADEKRLYAWLMEMDYETIVAGLQKFVRVLKPEWEYAADELIGDEPYFTFDRMYYIIVDEDNLDTVRRAFEVLFENHRGRYTAIVEGILSEAEDFVEEEAYRRREIRLSDRGFPDYETSMKAYVPLDKKGFEDFEAKRKGFFAKRQEENQLPNYLVLWTMEPLFFDKVLPLLGERDPELLEGVYEELAWLCNKLVVCHGMDFASEEKVRGNVERARSFLSLGLELLSGGDTAQAAEILRTKWIETVFRYAVGILYRLRDGARAIVRSYWNGSLETFFDFIDPPYEFPARGMLESIPYAYDFNVTDNVYHLREFRSLEDLRRAELTLSQLEIMHGIFSSKLGSQFKKVREDLVRGETGRTFSAVLGTLYARFVIDQALSLEPLSPAELKSFTKKAFEPAGKINVLRSDLKEDFWNSCFTEEERKTLTSLWGIIFQKIQEQFSHTDPGREIETYMLTCLSVKQPKDGVETRSSKAVKKEPKKKK